MRRLTSYRMTATIDAFGNGTATTSTDQSNPRGKIYAVEIDYPAGTVAVTLSSSNLFKQTILQLAASNTDAVKYPRATVKDYQGTDLTYDGTHKVPTEFIAFGSLTLDLASGTTGQSVTVIVYVEEQ